MKSNAIFSTITSITMSIILLWLCACKSSIKESKTFSGEANAVQLAEQMFEAIGTKAAWCDLRSLYIKAEHTEPQMSIPYQSEIWRAIDTFEVVIEQQNDSFHVKGVFNENGGKIRYFDDRDTFRLLSEEQLINWEYDHNHNVYVLLHKLGCQPENYNVRITDEDRLAFYQDTVFMVSFGLDAQQRPHLFYRPNADGSVSGSMFSHWGTDGGLVHSAGGHPLDSNFMYRTEIWTPSTKSLEEMFGKDIYEQ